MRPRIFSRLRFTVRRAARGKSCAALEPNLGRLAALATLCACGLGFPGAANADELTRLANASFALTLVDMATTRESIAHTNGVESNPVARPFVRSDAGALGYAVLTTALERIAFHRHPRAFITVAGVETYASVHNYLSRLHALDITRAQEQAH